MLVRGLGLAVIILTGGLRMRATACAEPPPPTGASTAADLVDLAFLADGQVVEGKILSEENGEVRMRVIMGGIEAETTFRRGEVHRIQRDVPRSVPEPRPVHRTIEPSLPPSSPPPGTIEQPKPVSERPPRSERTNLLVAMSDRYFIGSRPGGIDRPSIETLAPFMESGDSDVKDVVKRVLGIAVLYDLMNATSDFTVEARRLQLEALAFALTAEDSPSIKELRRAGEWLGAEGGAIDQAAERFRELIATSVSIQKSQNQLRHRVRAMLAQRAPEELPEGSLIIRFEVPNVADGRITTATTGYATVTNRTGATLYDLAIVVDVEMNADAIEKMWQAELRHWENARVMEAMFGVDGASWEKRVEAHRLRAERAKLGYGSVVLVDRLSAGSSVKVLLGPLGDIDRIFQTATVTCYRENIGWTQAHLDVSEMRATIRRVVEAQTEREQRQAPQPQRRRPPGRR